MFLTENMAGAFTSYQSFLVKGSTLGGGGGGGVASKSPCNVLIIPQHYCTDGMLQIQRKIVFVYTPMITCNCS